METMRYELSSYGTEKLELNRHKKVLKSEVIRLRDDYNRTVRTLGEYREALLKIKTYFDAMFVPRISEIDYITS